MWTEAGSDLSTRITCMIDDCRIKYTRAHRSDHLRIYHNEYYTARSEKPVKNPWLCTGCRKIIDKKNGWRHIAIHFPAGRRNDVPRPGQALWVCVWCDQPVPGSNKEAFKHATAHMQTTQVTQAAISLLDLSIDIVTAAGDDEEAEDASAVSTT